MPVIGPAGCACLGRGSSCAWVPGCWAPVAALSPHADSATAQDSAQATTRSFGVMDMRASAMQVDGHDAALEVRAALCVGIPWREAMARTLRERGECGIRAGRASNGGWPAANETAAQGKIGRAHV